MDNKTLTAKQQSSLLQLLQQRFDQHPERHTGLSWEAVEARLVAHKEKLWSLQAMEDSGGEPDVIGQDHDAYIFCDCSPESPAGRRSLCYDKAAWGSRKEHKPGGNVLDVANAMGIQLLDEAQYRALQQLGTFDAKTSSWIATPPDIRDAGGALFGDYRYGKVFVYHNGASSYYAARGFRGQLRI